MLTARQAYNSICDWPESRMPNPNASGVCMGSLRESQNGGEIDGRKWIKSEIINFYLHTSSSPAVLAESILTVDIFRLFLQGSASLSSP